MKIQYSKSSLKFLSKLVLAWDPDFTKLTPEEAQALSEAENSGFIDESEIDWDHLDAIV